jgi:hypothetical protein
LLPCGLRGGAGLAVEVPSRCHCRAAVAEWTAKHSPPYYYWMYYLSANIKSLNLYRAQRNLSTFSFRYVTVLVSTAVAAVVCDTRAGRRLWRAALTQGRRARWTTLLRRS